MEPVACPACGESTTGAFCAHCGTAVHCRECGNALPADARFCTQCGATVASSAATAQLGEVEPVESPSRHRPSLLPWVLGGAAVVALAGVLLAPRLREPRQEPRFEFSREAPPPPAGDPRAVDLASMTPREAADRLFDRVMRTLSQGDSAGARQFVPMALAAYERAGQPDTDARYHLGALHMVGGNPVAARAQADTILASNPQHLFGLFTAAQAEQDQGNTAEARALYRRFLDAYDTEVARGLPEYQAHQVALPGMRAEAARVAGS